jgi:hypothetical protein
MWTIGPEQMKLASSNTAGSAYSRVRTEESRGADVLEDWQRVNVRAD